MNYSFFDGKRVTVTGGLGFIGSCVVRKLLAETDCTLRIIDKMGVGSNKDFIPESFGDRYTITPIDLAHTQKVFKDFEYFQPDIVIHLAAESHVDRSITEPATFVESNVTGTFSILEASRRLYESLPPGKKAQFRLHHVSTDEVFGSLSDEGVFTERSSYSPNSPYSATKAASDHLVRAWHHTYGLPVTISNCSNNFGPWQADEKLIPTVIRSIVQGKPVRLYGDGQNVRDWLYVDDHVDAIFSCIERGVIGETYCVGARNEVSNVDLVYKICQHLLTTHLSSVRIIFGEDRPGHDFRYAIDPSKIESKLGWKPKHSFDEALKETVQWYVKWYAQN